MTGFELWISGTGSKTFYQLHYNQLSEFVDRFMSNVFWRKLSLLNLELKLELLYQQGKYSKYLHLIRPMSCTKIVKLNYVFKGGCHSSVVSSAPTILRPQVWIPSTPSMLFSICIEIVTRKKNENKTKRGQDWPIFWALVVAQKAERLLLTPEICVSNDR